MSPEELRDKKIMLADLTARIVRDLETIKEISNEHVALRYVFAQEVEGSPAWWWALITWEDY